MIRTRQCGATEGFGNRWAHFDGVDEDLCDFNLWLRVDDVPQGQRVTIRSRRSCTRLVGIQETVAGVGRCNERWEAWSRSAAGLVLRKGKQLNLCSANRAINAPEICLGRCRRQRRPVRRWWQPRPEAPRMHPAPATSRSSARGGSACERDGRAAAGRDRPGRAGADVEYQATGDDGGGRGASACPAGRERCR